MASFFSTPEKTLKYEMRPAKGSETVLKTYKETGSLSDSCRLAARRCRRLLFALDPFMLGSRQA